MAAATRTQSVVQQHERQRDAILLALLKALLGLWGGFNQWDNRDLVSGQAARSAALVDIALGKTRREARSYAQTMLRQVGAPVPALTRGPDLYPRSGANIVDVYTRPAEQYLYAISQGKSDKEAMDFAMGRVTSIATMDVALAERDEVHDVFAGSKKVIGFRRVIHPERSKTGTCGLCIVAATRMYSVEELMELHNECKCTTMPVTADADPGLELNDADLKTIYAAAGSTAAADLKRTRVAIKEHGELGPILVRDGDHFRDVTEVNRAANGKEFTPYSRPSAADQKKQWRAQIASSERTIARLKAARDAGSSTVDLGTGKATRITDWNAAIKYHSDLITRLKSKLR